MAVDNVNSRNLHGGYDVLPTFLSALHCSTHKFVRAHYSDWVVQAAPVATLDCSNCRARVRRPIPIFVRGPSLRRSAVDDPDGTSGALHQLGRSSGPYRD